VLKNIYKAIDIEFEEIEFRPQNNKVESWVKNSRQDLDIEIGSQESNIEKEEIYNEERIYNEKEEINSTIDKVV
jgi:hypothetical protein